MTPSRSSSSCCASTAFAWRTISIRCHRSTPRPTNSSKSSSISCSTPRTRCPTAAPSTSARATRPTPIPTCSAARPSTSRCVTPAAALPRSTCPTSSIPSSPLRPRERKEPAWGCGSPTASCATTAAPSARAAGRARAPPSPSACRREALRIMAKADILIVDDEEGMLVVMQAILEMEGYRVAAAQKGAVAIDLLRQREFDVILTDLRLDDLDGMAILAAKNRWSPDTVAIMLTGYASLDSAVQALRQGAYDYLIKPCDVEELKATVARAVERRQLAQQLRARMSELEEANATIQQMNAQLQERVDEATAELRQRVDDLAHANEQISLLHTEAQEHLEQLRQLDRLKSQFLSMASHELKTPLTAISGFLQLALRRARRRLDRGRPEEAEWLQEQQAHVEQLELVNNQTFRLARLVDELLDVSRIESGKMELRSSDVDIHALAAEVAQRMQLT